MALVDCSVVCEEGRVVLVVCMYHELKDHEVNASMSERTFESFGAYKTQTSVYVDVSSIRETLDKALLGRLSSRKDMLLKSRNHF
jgi:hypothetical protein